ncbi:DUF6274 family protein [Streptomyces indicus]|uniref:Uncharacterized protein n=1 Tax=Streptomyces indicus TaxID=417292 RepID=A0A1G9IFN5_9ACTN|nr:DUF6274 family protein [Streptomyces indicus]SDL23932.1 hypothetical protein SAMN05421806_12334 [Streptomyces indicus]
MAEPARHATRALLRAHLSAAAGYRHLTRHCPICHRLLRLAMQPDRPEPLEPLERAERPEGREAATQPSTASDPVSEDESPVKG